MFKNFNIFIETHCMRLETAMRKENVDTTKRRMQCVSTLTATTVICGGFFPSQLKPREGTFVFPVNPLS
jgi:hypothetical protein